MTNNSNIKPIAAVLGVAGVAALIVYVVTEQALVPVGPEMQLGVVITNLPPGMGYVTWDYPKDLLPHMTFEFDVKNDLNKTNKVMMKAVGTNVIIFTKDSPQKFFNSTKVYYTAWPEVFIKNTIQFK